METENLEVKKEDSKPKKKRNWVFTLFACIATAIIVILAMNIGQNLSKTVDPDTNKSNNKEVVCEEKECNCEEENTTTDSNTNTESNSNTTTQPTTPTQPTATTYTESNIAGTYKLETDTYTRTIILSDKGLFEINHAVKNSEGSSILGNYIVENNTIKLNQMISQQGGGDIQLDKVVNGNIISADTISIDGQTYKRTENDYGMTMQSWADVIDAYVKTTEI